MEKRQFTRDQVRSMMHYDVKHCKIDPKEFNCLPPSFDPDNCDGWSMLCNSIFKKDETLVKAIHHLQETHDLNNGAFDPFSSASATFDLGQGFNFATVRQSTKRMTIRGRAKSIEKSSKDVQALPSNRDKIIKLQNDPSKKRQSQRKNAEKQKEIISRIGFFKNDPILLQFVPNIKQKTKIGLSWKKFLARNIKNSALKSRSKEKERTKSPAQRQVRARTTSLTKRITKNRNLAIGLMSNRNGKSTEIKKYYTHKITKSKNETQDINRVITKLAISGSQSPSEPRKQTSVFMKYLIKSNHKHKVLSNKCMALRKTIQNSITPSHMSLNQTRQSHRVKRWESLNKTRQTPRIPQISSSTEVKILPPSSKRGTRQNTQTQKLQNIYIIPRVP